MVKYISIIFLNILVGGLIINDKDASNTKLVIEIIKNLSKKVNFFYEHIR